MSFTLTFGHFGSATVRFLENSYYIDLSWRGGDCASLPVWGEASLILNWWPRVDTPWLIQFSNISKADRPPLLSSTLIEVAELESLSFRFNNWRILEFFCDGNSGPVKLLLRELKDESCCSFARLIYNHSQFPCVPQPPIRDTNKLDINVGRKRRDGRKKMYVGRRWLQSMQVKLLHQMTVQINQKIYSLRNGENRGNCPLWKERTKVWTWKRKGGAAVIERRFDPVASSKSQTNRTKIVILLCWGGVSRRIYVGADISRLLITVRSFKMLLRE